MRGKFIKVHKYLRGLSLGDPQRPPQPPAVLGFCEGFWGGDGVVQGPVPSPGPQEAGLGKQPTEIKFGACSKRQHGPRTPSASAHRPAGLNPSTSVGTADKGLSLPSCVYLSLKNATKASCLEFSPRICGVLGLCLPGGARGPWLCLSIPLVVSLLRSLTRRRRWRGRCVSWRI